LVANILYLCATALPIAGRAAVGEAVGPAFTRRDGQGLDTGGPVLNKAAAAGAAWAQGWQ
jgi:hypothetical protein